MNDPDPSLNMGFLEALGEALTLRQSGALDVEELRRKFPDHAERILELIRVADVLDPPAEPGAAKPARIGTTGARVAHYRILEPLGHGGQGYVYLAEDTRLHRKVALKLLPSSLSVSASARLRFAREAEAASQLQHPGICTVFEVGEEDGVPFIAMERIEGESLSRKIGASVTQAKSDPSIRCVDLESTTQASDERPEETPGTDRVRPSHRHRGRLEINRVVALIEQAARALHAAHEHGLVHRDVKPGNLMITRDGRPVIVDFGLAGVLEGDGTPLTRTGDVMGTPVYMSPEQIEARTVRIDRRTDVYSLGILLFECVTLRVPFTAPTREGLYRAILTREPPDPRSLNRDVGRDLAAVIQTAVEKEPDRRYQTAAAFGDDLEAVAEGRPVSVKPVSSLGRLLRWARRNPATSVATAAAAVLLIALVAFIAGRAIVDRSHALAAAEAARREAREKIAAYARESREVVKLARAVRAKHDRCFTTFVLEPERAELNRMEDDLGRRRDSVLLLLQDAKEALDRASRLEAPYGDEESARATRQLRAKLAVVLREDAITRRDLFAVRQYELQILRYDTEGRFAEALREAARLTVEVEPADAAVFLFRYVPYGAVRSHEAVISRLVPVPSTGTELLNERWIADEDFGPGDFCLAVTEVAPGSPAAASGLRRGDLVVRLNGRPCGRGLFVKSPRSISGVRPFDRIERFDDEPVDCEQDWRYGFLSRPVANAPPRIVPRNVWIEGQKHAVRGPGALECMTPEEAVAGPAPGPLNLVCLRGERPVVLDVRRGEESGIKAERCAYPLFPGTRNRIAAGRPLTVEPGSYLLLVRREGWEDQRFPVQVDYREDVRTRVELLRAGTTPAGFVYIPPGTFSYGGDRGSSLASVEPQEIELPAFWIGRFEVTNRDWFAFMNDKETLAEIAERRGPRDIVRTKLPQPFVIRRNGTFRQAAGADGAPIVGPSRRDVDCYLAWLNARARAAGEPFTYDLPTEQEWEKAARGVDARLFPWGNRFDFCLAVSKYYRPRRWLGIEPGGVEPRDESPYGVRDLAGSRQEWARDVWKGDEKNFAYRGGSWSGPFPPFFRAPGRRAQAPYMCDTYRSFRLVLHRAKDGK